MRIRILYQHDEFEEEERRKIEDGLKSCGFEVEGESRLIESARREKRFLRVEIFRRLPKFLKKPFYAYFKRGYPRCKDLITWRELKENYWIDALSVFEEIHRYAIEENEPNVIFVTKTPIVRVLDLKIDGGLSCSLGRANLAICGSESIEELIKLILHEIWHWKVFRAGKI